MMDKRETTDELVARLEAELPMWSDAKRIMTRLMMASDDGTWAGETNVIRAYAYQIATLAEELQKLQADAVEAQVEILAASCRALDKAHALLSVVAGVVKDGEQRMPIGVHGNDGIARYLTASFVKKCADWCEGEYEPHQSSAAAEVKQDGGLDHSYDLTTNKWRTET